MMRPKCACTTNCRFTSTPGSAYAARHDPNPEVRAEAMRQTRRGQRQDATGYVDDALGYFANILGVELTAIQRGMVRHIVDNPRAALACGQRTGRTLVFAALMLWWADSRSRALSLLSTPSQAHMRGTIWRQVLELIRSAPALVKRCDANELPTLGVQFDNGSQILGVASDSGARLQGYAASGGVRIFGDEFQGYPESLVGSLMSNIAGGGDVAIGGNPLVIGGYYEKRWSTPGWACTNVSSLDVARSLDRRPGQATEQWCQEMADEFGVESIVYRGRVLGQFSASNVNGVFTLVELEEAQQRHEVAMLNPKAFAEAGELHLGVDVARTGADATCVVARRGHLALAPQVWRIPDLVTVADKVLEYARTLRGIDERPIVKIDGVGVGASVVDVLRRAPDVTVVEVQASATPERDAYTNVRSESTFLTRDWVRAGGCLPRDSRLEGEMAALTYCFDQRNKLKIRSKDELRKELGRSTDRFDALALSIYNAATMTTAEMWEHSDLEIEGNEIYRYLRPWNG